MRNDSDTDIHTTTEDDEASRDAGDTPGTARHAGTDSANRGSTKATAMRKDRFFTKQSMAMIGATLGMCMLLAGVITGLSAVNRSGTPVFAGGGAKTTPQTGSDAQPGSTYNAADTTSTPPALPQRPQSGQQNGGRGGADTQSYDYTGSMDGALTADGEDVTSDGVAENATEPDQNAALAENGGTLAFTGATLTKSGNDTNGDNCNFYGINSIMLAAGSKSAIHVSGSTLSATSEGSNGIFSTDGATVYANDDTIDTTAGNSRGLDATYGGTIVANKMTISTQGDHSGGIATDRGGGNISVTDSTVSTSGSGSPIIYSTGVIEASGVTGTATGSQIAGMEGLNTILIYDSDLTSTITKATASDPIADGVIIYQSTSGDADTSSGDAARFQAVDSTVSSSIESGSMFYLTNTTANVVLKNTTLDFDSSKAALVTAEGNYSNNWGSAGSNGATVNFTGIGETLSGDAVADTISTLDMYLLDGTTWTGSARIEDNASASTTADDNLSVAIDSTSTWVVTDDSTVTNLSVSDGGRIVDSEGNTVTVKDSRGSTLAEGTSDLTVTVTGAYGTTVSASEANEVQNASVDRTDFDDYYGTGTAFGDDGDFDADASGSSGTTSQPSTQDQDSTASDDSADASFWDKVAAFFKALWPW